LEEAGIARWQETQYVPEDDARHQQVVDINFSNCINRIAYSLFAISLECQLIE